MHKLSELLCITYESVVRTTAKSELLFAVR